MSARSLWLWLHGADAAPALAGPAAASALGARGASPPAANPPARETGAEAPAGEEFQPGVWARAAIGIYS